MRTAVILGILLVVAAALWAFRGGFSGGADDFALPRGGETTTETIMVKSERRASPEREIMVTDGQRHTVPLDEIVGGGPPKDGIPSIDSPKFVSPGEAASWLGDEEPGLAFERGGTARFYPYQILVWHEIVNDTVAGERILVTYCPLCLTGVVFDPLVEGERAEFGTSGKLWQSNLVLYDRKTDTLWSQVLGEAIAGTLAGQELKVLPSDQIRFGEWKEKHPQGDVLSRDTGAVRFYGQNPYGGYFDVQNFSLQLVGNKDNRLANDDFVYGLVRGGVAKAWHVEAVKRRGTVEDEVGDTKITLRYDEDDDVVRVFGEDGERINPISGFWFSWVAAHPETEVYK